MKTTTSCFIVLFLLSIFPVYGFASGLTVQYAYSVKYTENLTSGMERMGKKHDTPKDRSGACSMILWPDAVYAAWEDNAAFYDFKNRCIYKSPDKSGKFYRLPMYYDLDGRVAETQNRLYLGGILKASGATLTEYEPGQLEMLFGIPVQTTETAITEEKTGAVTAFFLDGKTKLAEFRASDRELKGLKKSFLRLLNYEFHAHPEIKDRIIRAGKIPGYMSFTCLNNSYTITDSYELKNTGKEAADSGDFLKKLPIVYPAKMEISGILEKAGRLKPVNSGSDKRETARLMKEAIAAGRPLDALLCVLDYSLSTGDKATDLIKTIAGDINTDAKSQVFIAGLSNHTREQAEASYKSLNSLDRKGLKYGHVIDIITADDYAAAGMYEKARKSFIRALDRSPRVAGCWKDLGDLLCSGYMYDEGWLCYETAERLSPAHTGIQFLKKKKKAMEEAFKDFF
jgi:tetratricopeptide (TPR) repeat protein